MKVLGKLQERILRYLAENPDKNKMEIMDGIKHPEKQYSSLRKAVDVLETEYKWIQYRKGLSKKRVEIKFYYCNPDGLFYVLTSDLDLRRESREDVQNQDKILKVKADKAKKVLEINTKYYQELEVFSKLRDCVSPYHFMKVLEIASRFPFSDTFDINTNVAFILAYMCNSMMFTEEETANLKFFFQNLPSNYKESVFKITTGIKSFTDIW